MRSIEVEANDVATLVYNGVWVRNISGISSRQKIHKQCCCLDFVETTWYVVNLHRCWRRNETLITLPQKVIISLRLVFLLDSWYKQFLLQFERGQSEIPNCCEFFCGQRQVENVTSL